mmetsp:Transcript_1596/g.2289  ORF Transcript_1596/g.2289 Transcript_1596/m.2289 type:complete len:87 (+) Transcript_1596:440-700(+)
MGNQANAVPTPHRTIAIVSMEVFKGKMGIIGVGPIRRKDIADPINPQAPRDSPALSPCPMAAILIRSMPLQIENKIPVKDTFNWSC